MAACIQIEKAVKLLERQTGFAWIDGGVLKIGAVPFQEQHFLDFASESLRSSESRDVLPPSSSPSVPVPPRVRLLKHGGRYLFDIRGKLIECSSLKDMLKKGLLAIEEQSPGMLMELNKVKARTRRIVAQKAADLFADPKLTKYAEPLKNGWFYGTNNNATTTKEWLKNACDLGKLEWGKDFDVSI